MFKMVLSEWSRFNCPNDERGRKSKTKSGVRV